MTEVIEKRANDLVCVMLDVHIWSGRRHLEKDDLIHANPEFSKLPEKELANLGSVKICDPDDIKKFQMVKGKAERLLRRAGLPILGAVGVPVAKFEDIHAELFTLKAEFETLRANFIADYDRRVAAWRMKHLLSNERWKHLFERLPAAEHVAGRVSFTFHAYRISAPADAMNPELNVAFNEQMHGLKGELLKEVADEAASLMGNYLMGKDKLSGVVKRREYVTPKTLGPLKRAAQKLDSFKFLDPSIGPLADAINQVLILMPTVGRIEGADLIKIWALSRMLSTPQLAAGVAANVATEQEVSDVLEYSGIRSENHASSALPMEVASNTLMPAMAELVPSVWDEASADGLSAMF